MKPNVLKLALAIPYVVLWQASFKTPLSPLEAAFISLFVLAGVRPSQFRLNKDAFKSLLFVIVYVMLLVEPGIVFGKLHYSATGVSLGSNILYSILISASLITLLHGIVMKSFRKKPMMGMIVSGLIYILSVTPVSLFLNLSGLFQLLLFNTSFVLILSLYLSFLCLKSNLNIMPGFLFLSIYTVFSQIGVSLITSQLFLLVWEIVALSVVLFITELTIKEPVSVKRAFRTKKVRKKQKVSPYAIAAIIFTLLVLVVVLPLATHETHYAIADPTDSMYPLIRPGSLLFVSYIKTSSVTVGTTIVFHSPWEHGTLFAHQVIGIKYHNGVEYFITKGVNNPAKDPLPVPATDLVGKVSMAIPYLGYLLIYSKVTAAVIVLGVFASFARESRKR